MTWTFKTVVSSSSPGGNGKFVKTDVKKQTTHINLIFRFEDDAETSETETPERLVIGQEPGHELLRPVRSGRQRHVRAADRFFSRHLRHRNFNFDFERNLDAAFNDQNVLEKNTEAFQTIRHVIYKVLT